MKLQIITNLFPLPWEPNRATFNRQQFEILAKSNDIRIIVIVAWLNKIKNGFGIKTGQLKNIKIDYLWYFYTPLFFRFSYSLTLFASLVFKVRDLRKFKPDCLLLSWAYPDAVAGTLLGRLLKIPIVIKVHGSDINEQSRHWGRARQIVWSMEKAAAVISVSEALAPRLEELGVSRQKINVIYNGIDHKRFFPSDQIESRISLGLNPVRKVIVFIGNLKRAKGCFELISAFSDLAQSNGNVDLYLIGSGSIKDELNGMVNKMGLRGRVQLLGSKKHTDLAKWFSASNAVALPSYNEGVPNVLLEAMACGVPVVATRVGGIPEIVSVHSGILVEHGDSLALKKALGEVLERNWDKNEISDSVKTFTWEKNSDQVNSLLENVVNGPM